MKPYMEGDIEPPCVGTKMVSLGWLDQSCLKKL